jgi:hypothetical protein
VDCEVPGKGATVALGAALRTKLSCSRHIRMQVQLSWISCVIVCRCYKSDRGEVQQASHNPCGTHERCECIRRSARHVMQQAVCLVSCGAWGGVEHQVELQQAHGNAGATR